MDLILDTSIIIEIFGGNALKHAILIKRQEE
jgi:predicted nucleic acid-binding protein